jgi:His-Xaa-Ser system radical SAM maturase HxsB
MPYVRSIYRYKKLREAYLITSEFGTWMFLHPQEFDQFVRWPITEVDRSLRCRLRDRHFIVDPTRLDGEIASYCRKYGNYFDGPSLFVIGTTQTCNLYCEYCQANATPEHVGHVTFSGETIARIIDFILSCPGKYAHVEFQGGEPLLEFSAIRKFIYGFEQRHEEHTKRIRFIVSTNLTLLTDAMIRFFIEHDVRIVGSIDGPEQVHDDQRRYPDGRGSHEDAIAGFTRAATAGASLDIIAVATRNSVGNIEAIVDQFADLGSREFLLNWPQRNGRALEQRCWDRIGLTGEEYFRLWKAAIEYIAARYRDREPPFRERYLQLALYKILTPYTPDFMDWRSPCGAAIGQLSFDHDGNIYPCDEARGDSRLRIGNVHGDNFGDVIERQLTQRIISSSLLENGVCDACVYKPFCGLCPVLAFKSGGEFHSFQEFANRCQFYTGLFDYVFLKILDGDSSVFPREIGAWHETGQ